MRQDQIALKGGHIFGGNFDACEFAKTCVDAVDGGVTVGCLCHKGLGSLDARVR